MPATLDALLNRHDVMERTQLSWNTLWRAIEAGELRCVRVGSRVLFRPGDVSLWLERKLSPVKKRGK